MLPLDDSMEDVTGDDEEKSIVEKTIETVKEMATSVTDAAKHAMEPEPLKPEKGVVTMPPPMDAGTKRKSAAKKTATKSTKKAAKKSAAKKNKKTAKKSSVRSAKKAKRKSKK